MQKRLTVIFILLYLNCSADFWIQKASVGGSPRNDAVGFSIKSVGKGYVGTGGNGGGGFMNDFWEYNPTTNIWTQKANYPGLGNNGAMGFSMDSMGYILGGHIGITSFIAKDMWEYNPVTNNWTQKANLAAGPRCYSFTFSIGTKGYMGAGWDSLWNPTSDFWEYDATINQWTQKANYGGGAKTRCVGISTSTNGYACMGNSIPNSDFWEYHPLTNTWAQKANIAGTMYADVVGFSICEKIYIGTGQSTNAIGVTDELWQYEPTTNIWTQKANFIGTPRDEATGFSVLDKGYIGTGYFGLNDWYEYTPDSCNFTEIPELINADDVNIYPIPFNDKLNISFKGHELLEVALFDITFKKLLQQKFVNSISLNTKQLPKGIYLYEVRCGSSVCKKGKVVKD